jgi:hypothetical protein
MRAPNRDFSPSVEKVPASLGVKYTEGARWGGNFLICADAVLSGSGPSFSIDECSQRAGRVRPAKGRLGIRRAGSGRTLVCSHSFLSFDADSARVAIETERALERARVLVSQRRAARARRRTLTILASAVALSAPTAAADAPAAPSTVTAGWSNEK